MDEKRNGTMPELNLKNVLEITKNKSKIRCKKYVKFIWYKICDIYTAILCIKQQRKIIFEFTGTIIFTSEYM